MFVALKRPPGCVPLDIVPLPDVLRRTDATSNAGRGAVTGACPSTTTAADTTATAMMTKLRIVRSRRYFIGRRQVYDGVGTPSARRRGLLAKQPAESLL